MTQIKTMDDALALAAQAGDQTKAGIDSIMALAKVAFGATRAKVCDKDNVAEIYAAYLAAANQADFAMRTADADAIKFGVSKLRVFVRLAAHKGSAQQVWDGVVGGTRTYCQKKGEAGKKVGSIYEQVLKVARYSLSKEVGTHKLTQAQIAGVFAKDANEDADEVADMLDAFVKRATKALDREDNSIAPERAFFLAAARDAAREQLVAYKEKFTPEQTVDDEDEFDAMSGDELLDAALAEVREAA